MRTCEELVGEVAGEHLHRNARISAIICAFEEKTEFVFVFPHREGEELEVNVRIKHIADEVRTLLKRGAQAIGLLLLLENGVVYTRKFQEWNEQAWVDGYISKLGQVSLESIWDEIRRKGRTDDDSRGGPLR